MNKKAKLSELNKELNGKNKPATKAKKEPVPKLVKKPVATKKANPIRGERGDFLKVTITLPPDMLADLKRLGIERKLQGLKDTDTSSLIREAVTKLLES